MFNKLWKKFFQFSGSTVLIDFVINQSHLTFVNTEKNKCLIIKCNKIRWHQNFVKTSKQFFNPTYSWIFTYIRKTCLKNNSSRCLFQASKDIFLPDGLYSPTKQSWGCPTDRFDFTHLLPLITHLCLHYLTLII